MFSIMVQDCSVTHVSLLITMIKEDETETKFFWDESKLILKVV